MNPPQCIWLNCALFKTSHFLSSNQCREDCRECETIHFMSHSMNGFDSIFKAINHHTNQNVCVSLGVIYCPIESIFRDAVVIGRHCTGQDVSQEIHHINTLSMRTVAASITRLWDVNEEEEEEKHAFIHAPRRLFLMGINATAMESNLSVCTRRRVAINSDELSTSPRAPNMEFVELCVSHCLFFVAFSLLFSLRSRSNLRSLESRELRGRSSCIFLFLNCCKLI